MSLRRLNIIYLTVLGMIFTVGVNAAPRQIDDYTIVGDRNYMSGYNPINDDGTVNVVVEIPAGTNAKWEVDKNDGYLRWEFKNEKPRIVKYLPYPGNYGMIPGTSMNKDIGGDGDPVDVLILGSAHARGAVVPVKIIGMLKMADKGELDHKLIALDERSVFESVNSMEDLLQSYPGIDLMIETWFSNYKGSGKIVTQGYSGPEEAMELIRKSLQ